MQQLETASHLNTSKEEKFEYKALEFIEQEK
jgi:hypothetical protein